MSAIRNHLCSFNFQLLRWNYEFGEKIRETNSRIYAIAISPVCGICFIGKVVAEACLLILALGSSLIKRRLETGNIQVGVINICHLIKHLAGVVFGSIVGIISPQRAVNCFLTRNGDGLPRALDPVKAAILYSLLYGVTRFFELHEIDYRMTAGTFLGAIRHEGVIPWDDDIDLFLDPSAKEKLDRLVGSGAFEKETGLSIKWHDLNQGYHTYYEDGEETGAVLDGAKFPFMDLFCTRFDSEGRRVYLSRGANAWSPREYYSQEEWEESVDYPFGPLTIKGPKMWKPIFQRCFGEGAEEFAYQLYHHDSFSVKKWPQWVYVKGDPAVAYDANVYQRLVDEIDHNLALASSHTASLHS